MKRPEIILKPSQIALDQAMRGLRDYHPLVSILVEKVPPASPAEMRAIRGRIAQRIFVQAGAR